MINLIIQKIKSASNYIFTFLRWGITATIIGIIGGVVGGLFHISVSGANNIFAKEGWLIFLLPLGGVLIVLMYKMCKMLNNRGTDCIISSIRNDERVPILLAPLIFISTTITHLLGGSAGREGAALQLGGSIGSNIGALLRFDKKDMPMAVMCGMSAVFSALFGTPITAAVFALGVTSVGIMYYSALVPCLISSLTAFTITTLAGIEPTHFALEFTSQFDAVTFVRVVLLAVLCAELSIIFCTAMHYSVRYLKIWFRNPYLRIVVGAIVIIALTFIVGTREYNGSGMDIVTRAVLDGEADGFAWALKIIFTAITIGAGFKGGEIVPTFFIGATFGCVVGKIIGLDQGFAAAIGMIAMFCGVLNCPIASIILSIELFGADGLIFFAVAAAVSYMLSGYYGLYSSQKIMYSKLTAEYINVDTK